MRSAHRWRLNSYDGSMSNLGASSEQHLSTPLAHRLLGQALNEAQEPTEESTVDTAAKVIALSTFWSKEAHVSPAMLADLQAARRQALRTVEILDAAILLQHA
jgi:putative heme degradation protein